MGGVTCVNLVPACSGSRRWPAGFVYL